MSKSRSQDDHNSINLHLLSHDDLDDGESTLLGDQPVDHSYLSQHILSRSRTSSPEFSLRLKKNRRALIRAICGLSLLAIFVLILVVSRKPIAASVRNWHAPALKPTEIEQGLSSYRNKSLYIAPERTPRFRDNLLSTVKYVTASPIGGFSNQVMAQINLLYLAVLTGRVPVIADFVPGHMHGNPGFLAVSEVYDLPRLAEDLRIPVIEWADIKNRSSHEMEEIGCWSLHTTLWGPEFGTGGHFATEHEFSLDISLTPVPDSRFTPGTNHLNIMAVATLGWPETRSTALVHAETLPSRINKHKLLPDEHMLCFDEVYYAASVKPYEWFEEWVPAWTQVGKYLRWEPKMEELARSYIMGAFGLNEGDPFPLYISVHIRHTDFAQMCKDGKAEDCFPPLSVYGEKVEEIKADLLGLRGLSVDKVLVASDEEDVAWWDSVREFGWHRIDWVAEKTEELYSEWYPIVLDSVALSLGKGLVGTTRSTLSLLAAKRVEDWEGGFVREVHLATS